MTYRFLLVSMLLALGGCKDDSQKQGFAPVVGVVHVKTKDIPLEFEAAGKVYGAHDIQIRAQVSGILKERRFEEGQYVNEGDSLFLIDPQVYQAALNAAEGDLAQAQSERKRTKRDYNRMNNLFKVAAVSKKDYDDAVSAVERAEANLKVAEARVEQAKINLAYTDVKAPISGYVRKEYQSVGNLISTVGDAALLTSMVQLDPVKVQFAISGEFWRKTLEMARIGIASIPDVSALKVQVILPDGKVHSENGKIIFIDKAEDANTATITMKAEIPNKDLKLVPGQFVRVKVTGASYKCPVVPNSCILAAPQGYMVYAVGEGNKASARPVSCKLLGNDAIITEGLKAGDVVVSEGLIKVRNAAPLTPVFKDGTKPQANGGAKPQASKGAR